MYKDINNGLSCLPVKNWLLSISLSSVELLSKLENLFPFLFFEFIYYEMNLLLQRKFRDELIM